MTLSRAEQQRRLILKTLQDPDSAMDHLADAESRRFKAAQKRISTHLWLHQFYKTCVFILRSGRTKVREDFLISHNLARYQLVMYVMKSGGMLAYRAGKLTYVKLEDV